jgi:hypothetical protein
LETVVYEKDDNWENEEAEISEEEENEEEDLLLCSSSAEEVEARPTMTKKLLKYLQERRKKHLFHSPLELVPVVREMLSSREKLP